MPALWKRSARAVGIASAAFVIAACGTENGEPDTSSAGSEPSSSSTPSEDTQMPECADIWVDGQDLPVDYKACSEDGVEVKPVKRMCGFGRPLVEHDRRFYAMPGNRINDVGDLSTSEQYKRARSACQA